MSQLKRLFQLVSVAIPLGLCFIPTSAYAFRLTILGKTIIDESFVRERQFNFSDTPARSLNVKGTLTAKQGTLSVSRGVAVPGIVLNLTDLEVRNSGDNIVNLANFITFDNRFTFPYGSRTAKAYQVLSGNFIQGVGGNTSNSLSFAATVNGIQLDTLTSRIFAQPPFTFTDNNQPFPETLTGLGNAQTVVGQLTPFSLRSGNTLNLPGSACTLITTDTPVDLNQTQVENICEQSLPPIPEPSSAWSILALGVVGATSWLTHKRKFLQHNKD